PHAPIQSTEKPYRYSSDTDKPRKLWYALHRHVHAQSGICLINTSYAVVLSNAVLPAAARCFQFYLYVVFALAERKNDIRTEGKVPLRMTTYAARAALRKDTG